MTWYEEMTWCDGCGAEITYGPVLNAGRSYCCHDCSLGILCSCGERMDLDEEMRPSNSTYSPAESGRLA
jgi:hypothetical protein